LSNHDATRGPLGSTTRWDGQLLSVPHSFRFPCLCLKCASPKVEKLRTKRFTVPPELSRGFTIKFFPIALIINALFSKRAMLALPVCDDCYARWRNARILIVLLVFGLVSMIFGVILYAALHMDSQPGWSVVIPILLLIAAFWLTERFVLAPRLLSAHQIDETSVTLLGVHARVGEQIARAAQPKS
jgi:multisubunit Na+/H+ antiporter MnhG subunit